jgi:hypothetical protein
LRSCAAHLEAPGTGLIKAQIKPLPGAGEGLVSHELRVYDRS